MRTDIGKNIKQDIFKIDCNYSLAMNLEQSTTDVSSTIYIKVDQSF